MANITYEAHLEALGKTLIEAVKHHEKSKVIALLEAGAFVDYKNDEKDTPLHIAIKNNDAEITEILLAHNASILIRNKDAEKPAVIAARLKHWRCLQAFANRKEREEDEGNYGHVLFYVILDCKDPLERYNLTKALLAANADTAWHKDGERNSLLHYAVQNNLTEIVELLLKYQANSSAKNHVRKTPIALAVDLKRWGCFEKFLNHKATKKSKLFNYEILNKLIRAKKYKLTEKTLKIAMKNSSINNTELNTLLHLAIKLKNPTFTALLVKYGANPMAKTPDNLTILEIAKQEKHQECLEALENPKKCYLTEQQKLKLVILTLLQGHNQQDNIFYSLPAEVIKDIIEYVACPITDTVDIYEKACEVIDHDLKLVHDKFSFKKFVSTVHHTAFFTRNFIIENSIKLLPIDYILKKPIIDTAMENNANEAEKAIKLQPQ